MPIELPKNFVLPEISRNMQIMIGCAVTGVVVFLFCKQRTSKTFRVTATIPRPPLAVFTLHKEPSSFYGVLRFSKIGLNKHYTATVTKRTDTTIEYDLEHRVGSRTIQSSPIRTCIDEQALTFKEQFTALSTTFAFFWQFKEGEQPESTNVTLDIELTGPRIWVKVFGRVQNDFKDRFRITNEHVDELLPQA